MQIVSYLPGKKIQIVSLTQHAKCNVQNKLVNTQISVPVTGIWSLSLLFKTICNNWQNNFLKWQQQNNINLLSAGFAD